MPAASRVPRHRAAELQKCMGPNGIGVPWARVWLPDCSGDEFEGCKAGKGGRERRGEGADLMLSRVHGTCTSSRQPLP